MMTSKVPWKIVSLTGIILGIIASVISIWTFLKVDRLEKFAEEAQHWTFTIRLQEPKSGVEVSGFAVRVVGKIDFSITASDTKVQQKINLTMYQKKICLVCFVRPVSRQTSVWYMQSMPVTYQDGSFEGLALLSDKNVGSGGIEHQIIVLAVPSLTLLDVFEHKTLPFYLAASNIISVRRIIDETH